MGQLLSSSPELKQSVVPHKGMEHSSLDIANSKFKSQSRQNKY